MAPGRGAQPGHARARENLLSRRLAREWAVHNKAELRIGGYRGLASDSPVSGSGDFGIDAVIYAAAGLQLARLRRRRYANDFEEGRGTYRWRAPAQWRRDLTVEGEVSANQYGHGAGPACACRPPTTWTTTGRSAARPSACRATRRALASGVSSNGLSAYARWRAHERSEWTLRLSPSRFPTATSAGRWPDGRERITPRRT